MLKSLHIFEKDFIAFVILFSIYYGQFGWCYYIVGFLNVGICH